MAGGQGTRLWPKSNNTTPKQFNRFSGEQTLLEQTYQRMLLCTTKNNIFVSINEKHLAITKKLLPEISKANIIVEPETKDTTSAILFSALHQQFNSEDILFFSPADHYIKEEKKFKKYIEQAWKLTQTTNQITLFGISPTFPADCYGYLKVNQNHHKKHLFVEKFIEKPSAVTAKTFMQKNYLWNSGMFLFSKKLLIELAEKHTPDHLKIVKDYYKLIKKSKGKAVSQFKKLKKISFDYSIMEKVKGINCLLAKFLWDDVGNWNSVYNLSKKDAQGNFLPGNVQAFSTRNTLVDLENKKLNVVLNGVKDMFIIQNKNNIYIVSKEKEKSTKEILKKLKVLK